MTYTIYDAELTLIINSLGIVGELIEEVDLRTVGNRTPRAGRRILNVRLHLATVRKTLSAVLDRAGKEE